MKVREKTYKRHSWENGKPSWIFIKTAGEHTWKWSNLDVIWCHQKLVWKRPPPESWPIVSPSFLHLKIIRLALVQRNSQRSWWLLRHSRVMQGINVSDRAVHRPKNRTALPVVSCPVCICPQPDGPSWSVAGGSLSPFTEELKQVDEEVEEVQVQIPSRQGIPWVRCDASGPRWTKAPRTTCGKPQIEICKKRKTCGSWGFHKWGDPKMDGLEGKSY